MRCAVGQGAIDRGGVRVVRRASQSPCREGQDSERDRSAQHKSVIPCRPHHEEPAPEEHCEQEACRPGHHRLLLPFVQVVLDAVRLFEPGSGRRLSCADSAVPSSRWAFRCSCVSPSASAPVPLASPAPESCVGLPRCPHRTLRLTAPSLDQRMSQPQDQEDRHGQGCRGRCPGRLSRARDATRSRPSRDRRR